MDILKRIDFVQQFAKEYADGAWSIDVDLWKHHVTPEFIEDIRQYIESLQLKFMYLQTQQAKQSICVGESYEMIDRFLRNNLGDDDYESYSDALCEIAAPQPAAQEQTSAVHVVRQMVEASTMLLSYTLACEGLLNAKPAGQIDIAQEAIAAGQKFIKENGK